MKKLILATALILIGVSSSFAQRERVRENSTPEERAQKQTEMMAEKLELSEDQKAQILAINMEYSKKRQEAMEARKAEMDARREQMMELREEMKAQDEKISKVLTEEQRKEWVALKESQRDRRGRRPGGEVRERGDLPRKRGGN